MDPNSKRHRINYQVVFGEQDIQLTSDEIAETKISISRALKVLLKWTRIKSILSSEQMIGKNAV